MLSLFPSLLYLSNYAPTVLRIVLATVLIHWAWREVRAMGNATTKLVGLLEALCGILLLIGLWTQAAALIVALDLLIRLIGKIRSKNLFTDGVNYYFILFAIALSLLATGPGMFSFDLPL